MECEYVLLGTGSVIAFLGTERFDIYGLRQKPIFSEFVWNFIYYCSLHLVFMKNKVFYVNT